MDTFYSLGSPPKSWVELFTPIASLLLSTVAIGITVLIAKWQRELQERQLKKDLFDRRFDIYQRTREFLNYVAQTDGNIVLNGPGYRQFQEAMEKAEMLCEKAYPYLREIMETASKRYAYKQDEEKINGTGDVEGIKTGGDLMKHLCGPLVERRNKVFRPYLNLAS